MSLLAYVATPRSPFAVDRLSSNLLGTAPVECCNIQSRDRCDSMWIINRPGLRTMQSARRLTSFLHAEVFAWVSRYIPTGGAL
jgi:hypothetical protein